MPEIPAAEPSEALREQVKTDAGPHATPDQLRAAEKRRAAMGPVGRSAEPEQRHAAEHETTSRKRAAKKKA